MERYKEMIQMLAGILRSTLRPVYILDDVPRELDPVAKAVVRNGVDGKMPRRELTVVSWNILRNYHSDKIEKTFNKIIKENNPDVFLIQEAPIRNGQTFWEGKLFPHFNAFYAPLHQVKKQSKFYDFSQSGQLTLTRAPFIATAAYQLPTVTRPVRGKNHFMKRLVLYTRLTARSGKNIGLYNVHLENTTGQAGRKKQLLYLLEQIKKNNDDIILIGGDFNTFLGKLERGVAMLKKARFTKLVKRLRPLPRLDNFYLKGAPGRGKKIKGHGSDHKPIICKIDLT